MKIGIVVPHIFMQREILPNVIFSPGMLAIDLAEGLQALGEDVTLLTPGPITANVQNITADMRYFEAELRGRGYGYLELLKKHPMTFTSLARQVQSELIAQAFKMANNDAFDIIHIYTNEEDIALPFAQFCAKPVVFTHHDPFRLLIKYKSIFPKYPYLNWLSMSYAQRKEMPEGTNWIANIYHGLPRNLLRPIQRPTQDYVAYLGRIIQPKGVHLAIAAVKTYNKNHPNTPLALKIAGKHYASTSKDSYWKTEIEPHLHDPLITYVGHLKENRQKQIFLGNARALLVPSLFEEPFGMVSIEALACGTPVLGLDSGAIPEIIDNAQTGFVTKKTASDHETGEQLARMLEQVHTINRNHCRKAFETRFTTKRMCQEHQAVYRSLSKKT